MLANSTTKAGRKGALLRRLLYRRHPTAEVLVIAAIFAAALLTGTFLLTGGRQDAQPDLPKGAQGVWRAQSSNTDATLMDAAFADSSRGWAVGVGGTVLHTSDGGTTWERQNSGTAVTF